MSPQLPKDLYKHALYFLTRNKTAVDLDRQIKKMVTKFQDCWQISRLAAKFKIPPDLLWGQMKIGIFIWGLELSDIYFQGYIFKLLCYFPQL